MTECLILTLLVVLLFAIRWHDKPSHEPVNDERASDPQSARWENVAIWSFVVISFAALLIWFYVISARSRGALPAF